MGFKNRISSNPNRKKLHIESIETDSGGNIRSITISGIERLDGIVEEKGTKLESKNFLRALWQIQKEGGIKVSDVVEIEGADIRYQTVNLVYETNCSFTFNYEGPELEVDFVNNEYFTGKSTKINNNQIKVELEGQALLGEITYLTKVCTEVTFRIKSTLEFVKTILLYINVTPQTIWPID